MLNTAFLKPRNIIVIGLVALIATVLFARVSRAVQGAGSDGAK